MHDRRRLDRDFERNASGPAVADHPSSPWNFKSGGLSHVLGEIENGASGSAYFTRKTRDPTAGVPETSACLRPAILL